MKKHLIYFKTILFALVIFTCQVSYAQTEIKLDGRDKYIEKAMQLFEENDWEAGKATVDDGLKKYPKDSDLKMLSGKYHHHKHQHEKARYDLVKALQINPNNVDAKHILVNVETETKRYSSAICYVNELLEVNTYWRGHWRKKIQLYRLQGNTVEANRLQERISQIYPDDEGLKTDYIYTLEMEAISKRNEGNVDEAIKIGQKILKENPDKVENYLSVSNDYLKTGNLNVALDYIEQGLRRFPDNSLLINKKAGILAEQKKYDQLLPFLQRKGYAQQYSYYLMEAARHAKNQETHILYGKVFEQNPGNEEAFVNIFNHSVASQQYDEALHLIKRQRKSKGESKDLYIKEAMVYGLMNNQAKTIALTKRLFERYPNDTDIQNAYVKVILEDAKNKMIEKQYADAIEDWHIIIQYGDEDLTHVAQNSIFNAYVELGEYFNALNVLNDLILNNPDNKELYLKRADIYFKQKNYHMALAAYETILEQPDNNQKTRHLMSYSEMSTQIIKSIIESFRYNEALKYTERWLEQDPDNKLALRYAINLSHQTNDLNKVLLYAQHGHNTYPDDLFFKIKLAEIRSNDVENYEEVYNSLLEDVYANPYHRDIIDAHAQITETYSLHLIKNKHAIDALEKLNIALDYSPDNNSLKFIKGLAFEQLKQYDSAYYYQSFYEPSIQEQLGFTHHLNYLNFRSLNNQIGLQHLCSRPGQIDIISAISSLSYSHISNRNTYSGIVNYAGRIPGKGFQIQGVWEREWNIKTASRIDAAWANRFFPKITINASIYREIEKLKEFNIELGVGYRMLDTISSNTIISNKNMFNFVLGATKTMEKFTINTRFNSFILDGKWLYNITSKANYNLWSTKHYITAMAGFGSSPDIELIDYQVYNGFSAINTMVGAGFSYLFTKNVTFGVLGTWYNYKANNTDYRNIHNIFLNLNVAF